MRTLRCCIVCVDNFPRSLKSSNIVIPDVIHHLENVMKTRIPLAACVTLWLASTADAQIVSGLMTVTGAEMH